MHVKHSELSVNCTRPAHKLQNAWLSPSERCLQFVICIICMCRCTLIDPRPQKVSKSQRKWLKSFATSQQRDTAAARASTDEAQSAFKPVATELSSSAAHHAMAQANVFAAEADALPDSVPAETSATEAELPSSTAHAQAFAVEAGAPHTGQQGGTVHSQQSASQDQACLPQQPNPQAEAQPRWPDLQGTLSHQLQVGHALLLVIMHLERRCTDLLAMLASLYCSNPFWHYSTCCSAHSLLTHVLERDLMHHVYGSVC